MPDFFLKHNKSTIKKLSSLPHVHITGHSLRLSKLPFPCKTTFYPRKFWLLRWEKCSITITVTYLERKVCYPKHTWAPFPVKRRTLKNQAVAMITILSHMATFGFLDIAQFARFRFMHNVWSLALIDDSYDNATFNQKNQSKVMAVGLPCCILSIFHASPHAW